MLVIDTSALVARLTGRPRLDALDVRLDEDDDWHAPHLLDVEFLHVLRKLTRSGLLGPERADEARADFADLTIMRYAHGGLSRRIWALRHNVTAYDAAFLALAELLEAPLITLDARLARAGSAAEVEVVPAR